MLEGEAKEVSEAPMLEALEFAHDHIKNGVLLWMRWWKRWDGPSENLSSEFSE